MGVIQNLAGLTAPRVSVVLITKRIANRDHSHCSKDDGVVFHEAFCSNLLYI